MDENDFNLDEYLANQEGYQVPFDEEDFLYDDLPYDERM